MEKTTKVAIAWNKGKKLPQFSGANNSFFGRKHSQETKEKIASYRKGKKLSKEWVEKIAKGHIGIKRSKETLLKQSLAQKGEKGSNWQGGKTNKNKLIRSSSAYKDWRKAVFERDDYTCQECFIRGAELHADHIRPLALYPDFALNVYNGRTLCVPCHTRTPSYLRKLKSRTIVCISGHFNPITVGHLTLIKAASRLADELIVVVANDTQVINKRGKQFMSLEDRLMIMSHIKDVSLAVPSVDYGTDLRETLTLIKPEVFAMGCGKNHPDAKKESKLCKELGIKIMFNVGGDKIRSSSEILKNYEKN